MPSPPALTDEQRKAALAKAAASRKQRAEIKEKLKNGEVTFSDLAEQAATDEVVGKMKVLSVLEALPRVGKVKARHLLEFAGISDTRRMQGLGKNQREKLLEKLAEY
jgi:signal recognition particle GTPase